MEKELVILRSVYGKVGQKYYINPCKDPRTGRFPDCVRPVNSNGDMILSDKDKNSGDPLIPENKVFIITDGQQFDLTDPWKKAEWEAIKHAPIIAPSRDAKNAKGDLLIDGPRAEGRVAQMKARYGIAELYVETPGTATAQKINRKEQIFKAEGYIFNDDRGAEGRLLRARLLGKNMSRASDSEVKDFLLGIAEIHPERIIKVYEEEESSLRLLFIEAKEKNIIVIKNKVYMYNDIVLGLSDDTVVNFLKDPKNRKIVELIQKETFPELENTKSKDKK